MTHSQLFLAVIFAGLFTASTVQAQGEAPVVLTSPTGAVQVTVGVQEKLEPAGRRLYYSVTYDETAVLLDAPFGLDVAGAGPFAEDLAIRDVSHRSADQTWQRPWGKRKEVHNRYNEMTLQLEETEAPHRRIDLTFRAYDDGVAFRYTLPMAWGSFKLASERTAFRFPGNPTVWAVDFGGYQSSQEAQFHQMPLNALSPGAVYGMPFLLRLAPDRWAAITEADLTDWAGMYLTPIPGARSTLVTSLSPRLDEQDVVVISEAPRSSPWRVVMLGETPGDLIESDIIENLNDPSAGDFSWVQPGKASWNWWNGMYLPDADFEARMNTPTMKAFVDLSVEMGWEYVLVDAGWYARRRGGNAGGQPADITAVIPALDMQELIRYAHERDVKVILWLHWTSVAVQMDEAFPLYEQWGVDGVKIDFMDRDDQEMVNFYHRVAQKAAAHHLVVDFHGAYKPTGVSRTFPNLITREGVLGSEYNKWSALVTPEHNVTIPFTRGMLGGMDYTPGGFRNRTPETFISRNTAPFVMGTRAHQLAMFVVYESALQVVSDSPYSYHISPAGTDFLKVVPATWDDTRVINGQPGDFITTARRAGDDWFIGSMSDEEARTLPIPLDMLGAGSYHAEIWADAYEAEDYPDRLMKLDRTVTAADTLQAVMAPGGGFIARLTPVR